MCGAQGEVFATDCRAKVEVINYQQTEGGRRFISHRWSREGEDVFHAEVGVDSELYSAGV